jgi:hypothetical protein
MTDKSLPHLVKDITYFYIKHFYEKECTNRNLTKLPNEDVKSLIETLYVEKGNDLKKYIRSTLKENLGDNYSAVAVENIIIEMFNDPTYSKHRVYLEIVDYQNSVM